MDVQVTSAEAVGKGPITVSFLFTNLGSQAAAIEKIAIAQMSGPKAKIEDCTWWGVTGRLEQINQHPSLPSKGSMYSGAPLSYCRPTKLILDGKETGVEPSVVPANSVRLIIASFNPDPVHIASEGPLIHCVLVSYYDRAGHLYSNGFAAWKLDKITIPGSEPFSRLIEKDSVKLLPSS